MKTFYTSDNHFFHKNIVKYCNRPFSNVDDMNEKMIQNWNETVSSEDSVYILGDFSFGKPEETVSILKQLNGNKHLIFGNHDSRLRKDQKIREQFVWCRDLYSLKVDGLKERIVLCHFPLSVWDQSQHGAIHLHGHCHGSFKDPNLDNSNREIFGASSQRCDVGVDCWNYRPVTIQQIQERLSIAPKHLQLDQHNEKTNR